MATSVVLVKIRFPDPNSLIEWEMSEIWVRFGVFW